MIRRGFPPPMSNHRTGDGPEALRPQTAGARLFYLDFGVLVLLPRLSSAERGALGCASWESHRPCSAQSVRPRALDGRCDYPVALMHTSEVAAQGGGGS